MPYVERGQDGKVAAIWALPQYPKQEFVEDSDNAVVAHFAEKEAEIQDILVAEGKVRARNLLAPEQAVVLFYAALRGLVVDELTKRMDEYASAMVDAFGGPDKILKALENGSEEFSKAGAGYGS